MPEMTTISTHQTIGLTSTCYTVTTDEGHYLGSYVQDHGSDVVHSGDLPEGDSGVVGPIEAIAAFTRAAGIKGWTLSENVTTACSSELTDEVGQRADALGGREVYVSDLATWAYEMDLCPSQLIPALLHERAAIAA